MPLARQSGQTASFVFNLYESLGLTFPSPSRFIVTSDPAKFGLSGSLFRILPLGFSNSADCNRVFLTERLFLKELVSVSPASFFFVLFLACSWQPYMQFACQTWRRYQDFPPNSEKTAPLLAIQVLSGIFLRSDNYHSDRRHGGFLAICKCKMQNAKKKWNIYYICG